MQNCFLVLQNGASFPGTRFGASVPSSGELVFTTSAAHMATLTDPCFQGQLVLQTSPLTGNCGVIPGDMDSASCHLSGYVVKEWCDEPVNFQSHGDLDTFLKSFGIAGVCGVDTRQITRILREEGTMRAAIVDEVTPEVIAKLNEPAAPVSLADIPPCESREHAPTTKEIAKVAFINCGAPHGCITALTERGCRVFELPYTATIRDIQTARAQAVVIGDGPGDPRAMPDSLRILIRHVHGKGLHMLGLGLGHLLMALAIGGESTEIKKLHHGHRGANQPIRDVDSGQVYISSLNQGYALGDQMLGHATYRNVNDDSIAGLQYIGDGPISVQFIPDGTLGPLRTDFIYAKFLERVVG